MVEPAALVLEERMEQSQKPKELKFQFNYKPDPFGANKSVQHLFVANIYLAG